MKQQHSVLVLTDHRDHKASNSIYALCTELQRHPAVQSVFVASRANTANDGFFYDHQHTQLQAWALDGEMTFEQGARRFQYGTTTVDATDFDWVWLRLPHPTPEGFYDFLRSQVGEDRIFNRPSGVEETGNKAFLTQFPQWCPDVRLCQTYEEVEAMQELYPIVLKPLRSYGGKDILKIKNGKVYEDQGPVPLSTYEQILQQGFDQGGYLGMRYLKNVRKGDKRVIVVNGQVLGAVLRMPPRGSWRCNAALGGRAVLSDVDENERRIAREMADLLLPKGIAMFGMDTLVNDSGERVLSELNTTSIGGVTPLQQLSGQPKVRQAVDLLVDYLGATA
jgi:glutathione synthase